MSFAGYLKTIKERTGKGPDDFRQLASDRGFFVAGKLVVKPAEIIIWLNADFGLGHGHAMAIVALLKGARDETSK